LVIEVLNEFDNFNAKLQKVTASHKKTSQNVVKVGFAIIKIIMVKTHMHR